MDEDVSIIEEMDAIIEEAVEHPPELDSAEVALKILELGIRIERLTKDHYSLLAKKVINKGGQSMFNYLASDEEEHIKTLKTQYEALKEDGRWLIGEKVATGNVCPLVTPEKKSIKEIEDIVSGDVKRDTTDLEALKLALEVEKRAIKFYCTAVDKTEDNYGKRMFEHLIEIETKHLKELEVQYAWLDQAGFWYDPHMMTD